MRLLGIALLALTISALLMLMVMQRDQIKAVLMIDQLQARVESSFDLVVSPRQETEKSTEFSAIIPVRTGGNWVSLSGFPAYTRIEFEIPRQAQITSAELILDLTSYLVEGATGRLRIGVNGARRGEILLASGTVHQAIRISLAATDYLQANLSVSLRSLGQTPNATCAIQWTGAAIVQLEPTSRIEIALVAPLTSLHDRLNISGSPNQIAWPDVQELRTASRILAFAWSRMESGATTLFVSSGDRSPLDVALTETELAQFVLPPLRARNQETWPVEVATQGSNAQVRNFEHETQWKLNYAARDLPDGRNPVSIDIGLRLQSADPAATWLMSVSLNGTLVNASTLFGHDQEFFDTIALPAHQQWDQNEIVISLVSAQERSGVCAKGVPAVAQLTEATVLNGSVAVTTTFSAGLDEALTGKVSLVLTGQLTAFEANGALQLAVALFDHQKTQLTSRTTTRAAKVEIVTGTDLFARMEALRSKAPTARVWLAWASQDVPGQYPFRIEPISNDSTPSMRPDEAPRVALLIFSSAMGERS